MTVMSEKGAELLADLPSYYANDRNATAIVDCVARELVRVEAFLEALRDQAVPGKADDTYGILSLWESMLGLPVAPEGVSLTQRQAIASAAYRKRSTVSGADWVATVDTLLNTAWSYEENTPDPYTITVTLPEDSGYRGGQVQSLLRAITPAHLSIIVQTGTGFRVDIDQVDIDTI